MHRFTNVKFMVYCVLGDKNRFSKYGEDQFYFLKGYLFRSSCNINRPWLFFRKLFFFVEDGNCKCLFTICSMYVPFCQFIFIVRLTLILLTWRKWWTPNNASKWQMGYNSAFKGLNYLRENSVISFESFYWQGR